MIRSFYNLYLSKDKTLIRKVHAISGFIPREVFLYKLALKHSSLVESGENNARECNERLEFLGDAVLDAVISEYLFKMYPTKDEGFLTEMRAKIVNRESLNLLCNKMRLNELLMHKFRANPPVQRTIYGNALEAFIGAVFLDQGFIRTKTFILNKIIMSHLDIDAMEFKILNYKSLLLEHIQKEKLENFIYEVQETGDGYASRRFLVNAKLGDAVIGTGNGSKKKIAEQMASEEALKYLKLIPEAVS